MIRCARTVGDTQEPSHIQQFQWLSIHIRRFANLAYRIVIQMLARSNDDRTDDLLLFTRPYKTVERTTAATHQNPCFR